MAFGASENTIDYATAYMNIYAIGTIFVEKIHPFLKKQLEKLTIKIPHKVQVILLNVFLVIILIDFVMSITRYSIALY